MKIYINCSVPYSTNPIFRKNFVPEIWAKMFSANEIAVFFNEPDPQNKLKIKVEKKTGWAGFDSSHAKL